MRRKFSSSSNQLFIKNSCQRDGTVCPRRLVSELEIIPADLADVLGCSEDQITGDQLLADETRRRLELLIEILDRILFRCGSSPLAWHWVSTTPIASLGNRTAAELIREGRAREIISHLDRIDSGGYT